MRSTDIPQKLPLPWAAAAGGGYIRAIPLNSQIGVTDGAASLHDGFVPLNATPIASGGVPPDIKDMNGILFRISGWSRWQGAGAAVTFDSAFSLLIGGYPRGAVLQSVASFGTLFISTVENNTADPDAGGGNWVPLLPVPATLAELVAGTDTVKYATAATLAGLRASTGEILAGVDTAKYLTPAAFYGARATGADVVAAVDDHKYLTALALAGATFGDGETSMLPGGRLLKVGHRTGWGGGNSTSHRLDFVTPFPNVLLAPFAIADGPSNGSWSPLTVMLQGWDRTGGQVIMDSTNASHGIDGARGVWWGAIGN